jgi:hypothetical protein
MNPLRTIHQHRTVLCRLDRRPRHGECSDGSGLYPPPAGGRTPDDMARRRVVGWGAGVSRSWLTGCDRLIPHRIRTAAKAKWPSGMEKGLSYSVLKESGALPTELTARQDGAAHRHLAATAALGPLQQQDAASEVHSLPGEAEDLPAAHPGVDGRGDDGREVGILRLPPRGEQPRRLLLAQEPQPPPGVPSPSGSAGPWRCSPTFRPSAGGGRARRARG